MNADEGLDTLQWLETMLPVDRWKRILYVGWHPHTFGKWGGDWYLNHIRGRTKGMLPKHTIIEGCESYVAQLHPHPTRARFRIRALQADVTEFAKTFQERFDVIIWWHGPEHVDEAALGPTLKGLEAMCDGAVILGCPDGVDDYEDPESGDKHRCVITESVLQDLGYQTKLLDRTWKEQQPAIAAVRLCGDAAKLRATRKAKVPVQA